MKKYPHSKNCKCGCKRDLIPSDKWWVNAPEYHNCFWVYMRHNQKPHTLLEISKLLNLSICAIAAIERKAMTTLKRRIKRLMTNSL